jgi:hypothetical protein
MKTQPKDAVAVAMDWLAQLREEDGAGVPPGGQSAIGSAPPAGDLGDVPPAVPPAGDLGDVPPAVPPAGEWEDAPLAPPPAADVRDAAPAAPGAVDWGNGAPAAPSAIGWEEAPLAPLPAADVADAVPPAHDWGVAAPAAPPARDWWETAPPAADSEEARPDASAAYWGFAAPAAPAAADDWHAAPPAAGDSGPDAVLPDIKTPGRAGTRADIEITERAAIGDELRIPLAWCEMGSCISHHADPEALGEADNRARAIAAGWRADALGRLACPQCQQGDSWFWTAHPVALWDRDTAVAMTTLMAAAVREITGAGAGVELAAPRRGAPGTVPGPRPEMARLPGRGRHRGHPAQPDRAQ